MMRETHTYSHTNTHNLPRYSNTPHTSSYTTHTLLTYCTHTRSSHPHTHKYINSSHTHTHTHSSHTHTPHTLTHTHPLTHFSPAHIHTHTHTHTSTEPTGAQTQETRGPRGSTHTPGTWSVWEQPRVPAGVSFWIFHTLGATGTPRSSLRTRETVEGTQADPARSRPSLTAL